MEGLSAYKLDIDSKLYGTRIGKLEYKKCIEFISRQKFCYQLTYRTNVKKVELVQRVYDLNNFSKV